MGWLDGPAADRVLCVSPSWRGDHRIRVQGGFVAVSPPAAEADALLADHHGFVRLEGTWQDGTVSDARVAERLKTNQPASPRSAAVIIEPTLQEQSALWALLKAGNIAWYRKVRLPDSTPVLRVGSSDLKATEAALAVHGLKDIRLIEVAWTAEDVDSARTYLISHREKWHVIAVGGGGGGSAADADLPGFSAEVLYVEPDFAAWADALPPGLLEATVLIRPAT
ncbi:MAG TPA: hypothetical protein VGD15_06165 [Kribbella sp.]